MKTIHKWQLTVRDGEQHVDMPRGAQVRSVGMQGSSICIWAEVDTEQRPHRRRLHVTGTGHPIPETGGRPVYLGMVQNGPFVWHVWEG